RDAAREDVDGGARVRARGRAERGAPRDRRAECPQGLQAGAGVVPDGASAGEDRGGAGEVRASVGAGGREPVATAGRRPAGGWEVSAHSVFGRSISGAIWYTEMFRHEAGRLTKRR